jgi:hypothetical protein
MKKIAVEVSGYMRSFSDFISENWQHNLINSDYEFDFFISSYIERGMPKTTLYDINLNDKFTSFNALMSLPIKSLVMESTNPNTNFQHWDTSRVAGMFRKIRLCHDTCLNYIQMTNTEYHCYIRLRADIIFGQKIEMPASINSNEIYLPNSWGYYHSDDSTTQNYIINHPFSYREEKQYNDWACDQFAIAGKDAMEAYANTGNEQGTQLIEQNINANLIKHNIIQHKNYYKQGTLDRDKKV